MERIEEKLLLYYQLSDADRREVDAYLDAHPEMRPLVARARAMDQLFDEVRHLLADVPSDEMLAYVLVTRHIQADEPASDDLRAFFDRVEAQVAADPDLQRRYASLQERLQQVEAGHDAVAQFERLTGTRLDAPNDEDGRTYYVSEEERPFALAAEPQAAYEVKTEQQPPAERRAPDRPAAVRPLFSQATRWAVAAVVSLVAVYGLLAVVSRVSQPPLERLAWIDPALLDLEGYDVRFRGGAQPEQPPAEAAYLNALALLQEAQTRTLGLFPRFDDARLQQAEEQLRLAIQDEEGAFVQGEARFLLAKVLLAQQRPDEARALLEQIAASNSRHAAEAASILADLQELQG